MTLASGTYLGRYEVLGPLGKGGMGEVYRARDTRLARNVALKVLPAHLTEDDAAQKRFEREAKAVAALSHPNILSLYDSGTHEGITFVVMELLEGETLRNRLSSGPLSWEKSLDIAAAIAEGLTAAHSAGIIHRDLKPENIFLTKDGRVKILDFGLARWVPRSAGSSNEEETISQLTGTGSVMGTIPYMSPEQVQGMSVDARSDIFSFGCILYEMLAGKRAFSGRNGAEITVSILREDPAKLSSVPPKMQRIVERCLQKTPEQRFQTVNDLVFALKDVPDSVSTVVSPPARSSRKLWIPSLIGVAVIVVIALFTGWPHISNRKDISNGSLGTIESLAVLPLQNLSGDSKQEYFADGMTEELIAKLAQINSLRVISRTSVMEYKGAHKSLPQIAKELNVDAIVEGSVMQAGERVRITAQLIHGKTDRHLWAESYERPMQDILAMQNEVASAIAAEVQTKLAPETAAALKTAHKVNPEAYQAYLRGLNFAEGPIIEKNLLGAVEMFQRSVSLDPNFASAYAQLSKAESFAYFTFDHSPQRLVKSKAAVDRAFQLEPESAEGHLALGYYYYRGYRDYDRAMQEWKIAEKSLPNNKWILQGETAIYRRQGKFEESLALQKKLFAMNPRDSVTASDIAFSYAILRKYQDAQDYYDLAISLHPEQTELYVGSAFNQIGWKGDIRSAREILNKAPDQNNSEVLFQQSLLNLYERKYQAALDLLTSPAAEALPPGPRNLTEAMIYRYLNKTDLAHDLLEKSREIIEKRLHRNPGDSELESRLGVVYAALGRKEEAINAGKRTVELLPVSKDAIEGTEAIQVLAFIYVLVGDYDAALDRLEYLLSIPGTMSVSLLRVEPRWDPLRNHPRFQKLLASKS